MNTSQVFNCLPKEAQQAIRIVELMQQQGARVTQAAKQLYNVTWDMDRLRNGLQLARSSMATLGSTDAALTGVITEGLEVTGAAAAGGGSLLATLGGWLPWLILAVGLTAGTYVGARQLGRLSAARPVQAGPAMKDRASPGLAAFGRAPRPAPAATESEYYIVRVNNHILSIRAKSAIDKGIPARNFRHGGLSTELVPLVKVGQAYPTPQAASQALAGMIEHGSFRPAPLAAGWIAKVGGKVVTIDDRGSIDMQVVRGIVP